MAVLDGHGNREKAHAGELVAAAQGPLRHAEPLCRRARDTNHRQTL